MALSKIDVANMLTGTIPTSVGGTGSTAATLPASLINNTSIGNVTALPAAITTGTVLQVVQANTNTTVTHSTSYADTTLTASITPSSTSNKILVIINQHMYVQENNGGSVKIFRNSTQIEDQPQQYAFHTGLANSYFRNYHSFNYLDSPSSTSALAYKTQARELSGSGGAVQTQNDSFVSYITLMEISA